MRKGRREGGGGGWGGGGEKGGGGWRGRGAGGVGVGRRRGGGQAACPEPAPGTRGAGGAEARYGERPRRSRVLREEEQPCCLDSPRGVVVRMMQEVMTAFPA